MMWLSLLLMNAVPVACFTILSIHFEKWWIALFALLFMVCYKSNETEDDEDVSCDDYDECE